MTKRLAEMLASSAILSLLFLAACGPQTQPTTSNVQRTTSLAPTTAAATTTRPASEVQQYGGTIRLATNEDITCWDDIVTRAQTQGIGFTLTNEPLWGGDWAKGFAGGYGSKETDWAGDNDRFDQKMGLTAESWKWAVEADNSATLVYQIRPGVHWGLNPSNEASRLVNGREMTADDVVFSLKQMITDPRAFLYKANPEVRSAKITKSGPWEVTIKLPSDALISAISRFGSNGRVVPPEVVGKYGDMGNWRNSVGTGPFMVQDFVSQSSANFIRNPNYWMKDPVGPGKGNQLPYLDRVSFLIVADASTTIAGFRTGKIDMLWSADWETARELKNSLPAALQLEGDLTATQPTYMRTDKAPFNDVKVRRAMMMSLNFQEILNGFCGGKGQILTFPHHLMKGYEKLYLSLDAPDCPKSVKELYTYNPDGARKLLKEAGYPDGFKTSVLVQSVGTPNLIDYYSIFKDMWSKVGISLTIDPRERGVVQSILNKRQHEAMVNGGRTPVAIFYLATSLTGVSSSNASYIDDPVINEAISKVRLAAVTDIGQAMGIYREMLKYVLDQAYVIPTPSAPTSQIWWPWVKNYSGEGTIGYKMMYFWTTWAWYDQGLKKSMGY